MKSIYFALLCSSLGVGVGLYAGLLIGASLDRSRHDIAASARVREREAKLETEILTLKRSLDGLRRNDGFATTPVLPLPAGRITPGDVLDLPPLPPFGPDNKPYRRMPLHLPPTAIPE